MAPIVHGLEVEYFGQIDFVYLDIDDPKTEEFKKALGFRYQPHYVLLDPVGNVIQEWLGIVQVDDFRSTFDSTLQ